ncbi:MAG: DUF488 family protein [Planctomycetaceae bacterium]|nr:DUF488 family protein [Planctomycetaceae bacterium]
MKPELRLKRVYDAAEPDDGCRVFVDRLWARGVSQEKAKIDLWPKELTPSTELRKWFHDGDSREAEFAARYRSELKDNSEEFEIVLNSLREQPVITLITATKDLVNGHAAILKHFLDENL